MKVLVFSAAKLRRLRARHGMTQSELSRLAGLHVNTVNDIESGRTREPSVNKVNRLAAALGVTVESLCRKG